MRLRPRFPPPESNAYIILGCVGILHGLGIIYNSIAATHILYASGGINQHLPLLYVVVVVIIVLTTQLQTLTRLKGSVVRDK
jgi:hypothetical protein